MKLRTLIVDDEPLARRGIALRLANHPDVELVGEAGDGLEAVKQVSALEPDLMFLDVQMPGLDGFGTLQAIPPQLLPAVVFVTAFDEYALAAFRAHALDYLLKPVDIDALNEAVARALRFKRERHAEAQCSKLVQLVNQLAGRKVLTLDAALADGALELPRVTRKLTFKDGARTHRVEPASVRLIEAAGDYMCVHTDAETLVVRARLSELESQLDPNLFLRVHRSIIVNAERVRSLRPHDNGEYFLTLDDGREVKLSRSYRDQLKRLQN